MASSARTKASPAEHTPALIRLLDSQGWDATTADQLAREVGVSRATFFRTFGSKEDVVFLDHAVLLAELAEDLASVAAGSGLDAVRQGLHAAVLRVLRQHTHRPEQARARYRLLRQSQALRNRELLSSHGYERLFARFLREHVPSPAVAAGLAGAVVAVHNARLRTWLRQAPASGEPDSAGAAEAEELLARDLDEVISALLPSENRGPDAPESTNAPAGPRTVVVTVGPADAAVDQVAAAVRGALQGSP